MALTFHNQLPRAEEIAHGILSVGLVRFFLGVYINRLDFNPAPQIPSRCRTGAFPRYILGSFFCPHQLKKNRRYYHRSPGKIQCHAIILFLFQIHAIILDALQRMFFSFYMCRECSWLLKGWRDPVLCKCIK
jgi:hypothetical protein